MKKAKKSYAEMSTEELEAATAKYDEPFVALRESRPLRAKDKIIHEQARKAGRPKIGKGAERVLVTIEGGLLSEADAYAKRHGMKRAELIARGLRLAMEKKKNGTVP